MSDAPARPMTSEEVMEVIRAHSPEIMAPPTREDLHKRVEDSFHGALDEHGNEAYLHALVELQWFDQRADIIRERNRLQVECDHFQEGWQTSTRLYHETMAERDRAITERDALAEALRGVLEASYYSDFIREKDARRFNSAEDKARAALALIQSHAERPQEKT